ncbi:ATPase family protein [Tsukamurella phage TIN4]|uniref:ATPase family protein n=2 Tax=Tinduovirus TIN3 TaxID=1982571 RepID=A0A0K0N659_9CAUD|nr:ATPase [Tsukamurella phage TIN3]YP_009604210.1 ATPase [Tsukamurella phage TIN4]AKJ71877.1 ATPase family protein [Tsukamurella phage TIN3]AKJ71988.1 ATPase family protein [Tsukamurella phage TIN4]
MTDNDRPKSCGDCIHRIGRGDTTKQTEVYGKPTMMSTCGLLGTILATQNMSSEQEHIRSEEVGSRCMKHNAYAPAGDKKIALTIGVGAPPEPTEKMGIAKTCRACYFYVQGAKVSERIGIPMGACVKFGKLIPDLKASQIAKDCKVSARSTASDPDAHFQTMLNSLHVDPNLAKFIMPEEIAKAARAERVDTSVDPAVYPTDRPVTDAQDKQGIRAWRRLVSGKREVFLPIFKREIFSPEEQAKIPATGDDEHPEQYVDHMQLSYTVGALWFHLDETPALHGKAGTGKTEFFRYMAWLMQLPFERISITRDSEIDDLAGKMHFENNETVFKPGRIPKAWVKPCVVVLDEPNTGPPEVWQYIRPLTDNSKQLVNDKNEGEVIKRHAFAFLGMAMNPAWDARNVGAEMIGDADGSRLMHIFVDMPDEHTERGIIRARCELDGFDFSQDHEDILMRVAKTLREMSDNGELPLTWGIRNQIKVARATAWFDLEKAYSLGVLDYLEPEVREVVLSIVNEEVTAQNKKIRQRNVRR